MKYNLDFLDTLSFIFSENSSVKDFFIIYDKKIKKVLPYRLPDEDNKKEELYFLISKINLKDKNQYFLLHSSELPKHLLNKDVFTSHTINSITIQCIERNDDLNEDVLNLNKFFENLKKAFNLTEDQINKLYEVSDYYAYDDTQDGRRILMSEYQQDYEDYEFLEFQNEIEAGILLISMHDKSIEDNIKKGMLNELNKNKNIIEDKINQRLNKLLDIIEPESKTKNTPKI